MTATDIAILIEWLGFLALAAIICGTVVALWRIENRHEMAMEEARRIERGNERAASPAWGGPVMRDMRRDK